MSLQMVGRCFQVPLTFMLPSAYKTSPHPITLHPHPTLTPHPPHIHNTLTPHPPPTTQWKGLPYSECTYEAATQVQTLDNGPKAVQEYEQREQKIQSTYPRRVDHARDFYRNQQAMREQPAWLQFGKLRDYQLDGLNWLVLSWLRNHNAILADEMGLGKTIQCVTMLGFLAEQVKVPGPFLVIVPLSVIPNWMREFTRWCPQVNTVVYVGDATSREVPVGVGCGEGGGGGGGKVASWWLCGMQCACVYVYGAHECVDQSLVHSSLCPSLARTHHLHVPITHTGDSHI